jgi:hypothetical protein
MLDRELMRRLAAKATLDADHLADTAARIEAAREGVYPVEGGVALEMMAGALRANERSVRMTATRLANLAGKETTDAPA